MADTSTEVPDGTAQDVLDWVDGDPQRAQTALEAENCKDSPRSTLTSKLEAITAKEEPVSTQPSQPDQPGQSDLPPSSEKVDEVNQPDPVGPGGAPDPLNDPANEPPNDDDTATGEEGDGTDDALDEQEELAPEQPEAIELNPADPGTVIGAVQVRDGNVEVDDGADLRGETEEAKAEERDELEQPEVIEADPVLYLQSASGTQGMILALNGTAYSMTAQQTGQLKQEIDRAVVGLAL